MLSPGSVSHAASLHHCVAPGVSTEGGGGSHWPKSLALEDTDYGIAVKSQREDWISRVPLGSYMGM